MSSNSTESVPFPDEWDSSNERAQTYYETCKPYVETEEQLLSLLDIEPFFHVFCIFLVIYIFITGIFIVIFRNKYTIKRNNPELTIYFSIGCLINILNSYGIDAYYDKYPCFLVFYTTGISYPLIFISCVGCISRYIRQYYSSVNAFDEVFDMKMKTKKRFGNERLEKLQVYLIDKYPNRFVLLYILIVTIYSIPMSMLGENYQIFGTVDIGFCTLSGEYAPQLILIISFLVLYIPFALNELRKIEDTFNIKNTLYISLITIFFCIIGYFASSLISAYNCTPKIIRYWPSDCFVILFCAIFHFLQVTKPLMHLIYIEVSMNKIDKSLEGLKKILDDKILFREFCEFCKKDCCVENTYFHKEYRNFKNVVNQNRNIKKNQDLNTSGNLERDMYRNNITINIDSIDLTTNNNSMSNYSGETYMSTSNNYIRKSSVSTNSDGMSINTKKNNNKNTGLEIYQMASKIINKFILPNSEYALNIDNKIIKKILIKMASFEEKVDSGISNSLLTESVDNLFDNLFDDAYEEVLTNLFLNSYIKYLKLKN